MKKNLLKRFIANSASPTEDVGRDCPDDAAPNDRQPSKELEESILKEQESNNDNNNDVVVVDESRRDDTWNVASSSSQADNMQEQCQTPDNEQEITSDNGCDNPNTDTADENEDQAVKIEVDSSSTEFETSPDSNNSYVVVKAKSKDTRGAVSSASRASNAHKRRRTSGAEFPCTEADCTKKCKTEYGLLRHLSTTHSTAKVYNCLSRGCDERFRTMAERDDHVKNSHPNAMVHTCEICYQGFRSWGTYNNHMYKEHWDKTALGSERQSY